MIIDLYFLILAVNAHIFNSTAWLVIPRALPTNEAKVETETQKATAEIKRRKFLK